jgi:uncharacterized protein
MARAPRPRKFTGDTYQNFLSQTGIGTNNQSSAGTYGFTPITRNHQLLEWAYRGSWIVRKIVDAPAEDMTRQGTTIDCDMRPDTMDEMQDFWEEKLLWTRLDETLKWSRLYGGAIAVIVIDGQRFSDPLRMDTVGKGQFQGLIAMDRWMLQPQYTDLVSDPGSPDYGNPKFYDVVADARTLPYMKIHHTRTLRFDGITLPYWQKMYENGWGMSILEPMWDRLVAFDSTTQGAAQLVFKAHLRTLKLPKLRENIAGGGRAMQAVLKHVEMMRIMQTNEGITLLDSEDVFETQQYAFAGLADMMSQFGMQLSGSGDVPLTRLFGQSPGGLNSTGDSDLENYRDGLKSQQKTRLAAPVRKVYALTHRSLYGTPLPKGFNYFFNPLGQLNDQQKATVAAQVTGSVVQALEAQIITAVTAAKELRQQSRTTGVFSNITDEDLAELEANPPGQGEMDGEQPPAPEDGQQPDEETGDEVSAADRLAALLKKDPSANEQLATWLANKHENATAAEQLAELLKTRRMLLGTRTRDSYPVREYQGLQIVIENPKGTRRTGYNWTVQMPSDYGYISGTSSAEGPMEQMDAFVGDDLTAPKLWIIEQVHPDTKVFDEHKLMIGFPDRETAKDVYTRAFSDGRGRDRIGRTIELPATRLAEWLSAWRYGSKPRLRAVK